MRAIISLMLSILVLTSMLAVAPVAADAESNGPEVQCDGDTRTGVTNFHSRIEYAVTYNQSGQRVCVMAKNTGEEKADLIHIIQIDGKIIKNADRTELGSGGEFQYVQNIIPGIDATEEDHTISVSINNNSFYFNFTKEFNTINESGVPTPHFENLTVKRGGTTSGQPRLSVKVVNEGQRTYVPEAEVRTLESDSRRLDNTPDGTPGGQYSVRLNEGNDDVIVGTVRLYGGKFNPGTKFDRVSFISYPNGTYETWEPEFGEIPTDREIEEREVYYQNETAREKYMGPDVDPISERASKVGAVALVALLVVGLWYRRR